MMGRGGNASEVLLFDVAEQRYGIPVVDIVELIRAVAVTPLPNGPRVTLGVINLRGRVVPLFDLRLRFGRTAPPLEPTDHFVIARAALRIVALRADHVRELVTLAEDDIQTTARVVSGTHHVAGIARLPDGVVFLQDLSTFLSEAEAATLDLAMANGAAS